VPTSPTYPDAPRPRWRRRPFLFCAVLVVVGLFVLGVGQDAFAATYTRTCGATGVWDPDVCERTEVSAAALEDVRRFAGWTVGILLVVASAPVLVRIFRGTS